MGKTLIIYAVLVAKWEEIDPAEGGILPDVFRAAKKEYERLDAERMEDATSST